MSKIYLPPDGALLNAIANGRLTWDTVFGEWIDNAFDAGARTISFEFGKESIRIIDDGRGCENLTDMVRLGAHTKRSSTRLGRYGIGGKDAALWVGGLNSTIDIRSVYAGRLRTLSVNWQEMGQNNWEVESPSEQDAGLLQAGTEIRISPTKNPPHGQAWKDLLTQLGYLYAPALKLGWQIKFKRSPKAQWEPLVRWELPKFLGEVVDARIVVNGRGARVYCGVVQHGIANPHAGFTYSHVWRVIQEHSARGCGLYSSAQVCGFVDLDASWPLTKNKDGVSKDADALYLEVERVALPVLERAHTIGAELKSQRFESEVNEQFNALLSTGRAKARRSRGETSGTKESTGTGGKHQRAEREQSGETFPARRGGRYLIDFVALGQPDITGQVKPPSQVLLNIDNPMVHRARQENNTLAVVILAASLLGVEHCYAPDGQPILRGLGQGTSTSDVSKAIGTILSGSLTVDGKPVLKLAEKASA
jgi:hypothetical protein